MRGHLAAAAAGGSVQEGEEARKRRVLVKKDQFGPRRASLKYVTCTTVIGARMSHWK